MDAGCASPIRVLVVDDHPILRAGVAAFLSSHDDVALVGEAQDGAEALAAMRALRPDVALIDLHMPGMNGVETIEAIRAEQPAARVLVLTTYAGDALAVRALAAGASGYVLKSGLRAALIEAIRTVHQGRRYVHQDVAAEIAAHAAEDALSARELQILRLVAHGEPNKQIARALGVSEQTIKANLKSAFAKLGVSDRTHAVTVAVRRGMLAP